MGNWDKVPWMIGGGVQHSLEVTRLLSYVAAEGLEGIVGSLDLEVRQRAAGPAASVRVAPGACSIINRYPSVKYDAYVARLPIEDVVNVAATTSGVARTDLVVARIKNPWLDTSFPIPSGADIAAGIAEFVDTYVITNMAGPTPGSHPTLSQIKAAIGTQSMIPLASIARAGGAATVAQADIKDWRRMAQFREAPRMAVVLPGSAVALSDATWRTIASTSIEVPEWATHFTARAIVGGAVFGNPNTTGALRLLLGTLGGATTAFNESVATGNDRATIMAAVSDVAIPVAQRGTSLALKVEGQKNGGTTMTINAGSAVSLDIVFASKPENNP